MKKLLSTLAILVTIFASQAALAWKHGPIPPNTSQILTPSVSWTGSLLSGFSGGVAPPSPTMTITAVTAGGAESTCGSSCIQLTVGSTGKFGSNGATGFACAKYVQGAGEANGCWPYYVVSSTKLDLIGSTYGNGTLYTANNGGAPAIVGVAYGAQRITAVAGDGTTYCNGAACPLLTVDSTANMTSDDSFSAFNLGSMTGLWPIRVIDGTHVALGTSNQPAPPYTSFSPTSISIIANNEPVIGDMDEHSGKVWEAGVPEYITYGAVVNNRNAIANVTCYFENSTGVLATAQSANPIHPDDGYVFQLAPGPTSGSANGLASLFCDAIPVNGLARRQALNVWINNASGDSSYANRGVDIGTMYVDASNATADSGACAGVGGQGTSPANPYSTLSYATVCGKSQLAGTVSSATGGFIVKVANNILNATATSGSSGTSVHLTTNCPAVPVTLTNGNSNLQNYVLYDITKATVVGSVSSCATSGSIATLTATAAVSVANADALQFQSPEGNEATGCPGGACFGNAKQVDVVPENDPVKVTSISAYSGTSATLTLSSRPASWVVGTRVLVTGMYPNEYNGYVYLTAVSANTITYTCCTIGGQPSFNDPAAIHPDAPITYGQVVVPYQFGTITYGTWNASLSLLQVSGAVLDMNEITAFTPCGGGACTQTALQPYTQGLTFNNTGLVDSSGLYGPLYGYFNYGLLGDLFTQSAAIRVGNLEDVYYSANTALSGASLMRNVAGISGWKTLNIATNFRNNTGVFAINPSQPVAQPTYTGITKARFPSDGIFQEAVQRTTLNPADNVSGTPCDRTVTNLSNCMPAVATSPVFQGALGAPSQVITSATGGTGGTNVVLTMPTTASFNNGVQYWVWGSSNSAMNKKWPIVVSSGTTITLTGSGSVGSPGIVANSTTIAPGQTTFNVWTSGGGGFAINYTGMFLTGNCAGDTLMAAGIPSSVLLANLGNLSYQGSIQTITGAGGGGASNATITMASTSTFVTGAAYTIGGNTNASFNRQWTVTVTNGTTLTLQGSTGIGAPGANGVVSSGVQRFVTGASGGGGSDVVLTVANTSFFTSGATYTLFGSSTAALNKAWVVTVVDGTHLDLTASTAVSSPAADGSFTTDGQITVFIEDNWTSGGTICSGGPTVADPIFLYTYAHPDFVQIQIGGIGSSTQLVDYNLYVQRANAMQTGLAPLLQAGGAYAGPGTITSSGTLVTMDTPLTDTATASGTTSAGSTTIQLTGGGCTGITNGLGAWDTSSSPNAYLGNVSSCNTGTDVMTLYGGIPIAIANNDGISVGTAPKVGDVLNVKDGTIPTGEYQSRKVVRVSPTFPSDGKVWVDYQFFPDISGRTWYYANTAANMACVACTSGGNGTPGIGSVAGLPVGNFANGAQWGAGADNFIWLQHTYGYGVQLFEFDNVGGAYMAHNVTFYDSIIGAGCPTTGCSSNASTASAPSMSTHSNPTTPSWTTLLSNGTNVAQGYTYDNNNYSLINFSSTVFSPGTNNTALGTILNDANYSPLDGSLTTTMRGLAGSGTPIFPWTRDGAPLPSQGAVVGAMQPLQKLFTPLHTYYLGTGGNDTYNGLYPTHTSGSNGPWLTPNHAVVCGDVIVALAGSYTTQFSGSWGTVSNCPSTTAGIDGTGGVYFATILCEGPDIATCNVTNNSGNGFDVTKNNWAIEGFNTSTPGTGQAYFADACSLSSILHHVAFINDVAYSSGYGLNASNCANSTNSFDYLGWVGNIVQNANAYTGAASFCGGAVDINAPQNFNTTAGTHIYIGGNFIYGNLGPTPQTCTSDIEGINLDTLERISYNQAIVVENNLVYHNAGFGLQLFNQQNTNSAPNITIDGNTLFGNEANIPVPGNFNDSEINLQVGGNSYWIITGTNNIARTNAATGLGSAPLYALNYDTVTTSQANAPPSFSNNLLWGLQATCLGTCLPSTPPPTVIISCCTTPEYLPAASANTLADPTFLNTTDLLANWIGTPSCTSFPNTLGCIAPAINDLRPVAGYQQYGYQIPGPCVPSTTFPTWLKGIVALKWDNSTKHINQTPGLVTKPCGL